MRIIWQTMAPLALRIIQNALRYSCCVGITLNAHLYYVTITFNVRTGNRAVRQKEKKLR